MSRRVTISTLNAMKAEREKFVMMTAYDATFSRLISDAGVVRHVGNTDRNRGVVPL